MGGMGERGERAFARAHSGLSDRRLREHQVRLLRGVYAEPGTQPTARVMAEAAWLYGQGRGVLGGRSAAAVWGVRYLDERRPRARAEPSAGPYSYREHEWDSYEYFDPEPPVLIRPRSASARPAPGISIWSADLPVHEVATVRGMRVTTPARTGFDLARRPASAARGWDASSDEDFTRRLVILDALCRATRIDSAAIGAVAAAHPRAAGGDRVREVLPLVDGGAASPPETRLRLLLHRRGYPRPRTQYPVLNEYGVLHAHVDLAWPQWKAGIEYDGDWHRRSEDKRSSDAVRYAEYRSIGWDVLIVDKHLLFTMQAVMLGFVDDMFARVGAVW